MKKHIALLVLAGLGAVSCSKSDMTPTKLSETEQTQTQTATAENTAVLDSAGNVQVVNNATTAPTGAGGTVTTAPATSSASGALNPEHGKPGHRCDIPVGAPLNSAPSVNMNRNTSANGFNTNPLGNTQPNVSTSVIPTPAPAATSSGTPAKTAPGMNPPHGEPGHRCDIPVGSPLNTPKTPTPTATTTQAAPVNLPATVAAPAPTASTEKTVTAPGMNPPHGEPGHRCDIAVGAPLK